MRQPGPIPDLFIVGAPRCGTTALYTHLQQHPMVHMATPKEPHFFSPDLFLPAPHQPIRDFSRYLSLFTAGDRMSHVGEASVFYLYSAVAPQRIRTLSPHARIIIMLRNPADMMYSMYCLRRWAAAFYPDQEPLPAFEAALDAEPRRLQGEALPPGVPTQPGAGLYLCYRELARYADRVERYLATFGRDHVHVVLFDDLRADPLAMWTAVCRFLDLDPAPVSLDLTPERRAASAQVRSARLASWLWSGSHWGRRLAAVACPPNVRRAVRGWLQRLNTRPVPPLSPSSRRRILLECADDTQRTADVIGRDLSHWTVTGPGASLRPDR